MNWHAIVERWSTESLLFIPELPGFIAADADPRVLVETAADLVPQYVKWLIDGELLVDAPEHDGIRIVESMDAQSGTGPLFAVDRPKPSDDQQELALAIGRAVLSDLLFVFDDVPAENKSAAVSVLRHVAELDRFYATRLAPAQGKPFSVIEDELVQSASLFEETVDAVAALDRPSVWSIDGEAWSVAKTLRRRTAHLREHVPEIVQLLA